MLTLSLNPMLQIESGIYAIAGISKNSGKTSFLNWILAKVDNVSTGVLTTGRDGEETDLLFGNPKPAAKLPTNTIFTSNSETLDKLGSAVEVLQKLPFMAGTKKLWLLKALRDIETEIVGPASVDAQIKTAELMQSLGAEIVLIDGSIDRKSIALNEKVKGVFLVVGGSFGTLEKINGELARLVQLSQISLYKNKILNENRISYFSKGVWHDMGFGSIMGNEQEMANRCIETHPEKIYLNGAVSDTILNAVKPALKDSKDIIIKHPLQLHLNKASLEYLTSMHKLYSIQPFKLIAIAVNSWSVKGSHLDSQLLRDSIRKLYPAVTVIDICEA